MAEPESDQDLDHPNTHTSSSDHDDESGSNLGLIDDAPPPQSHTAFLPPNNGPAIDSEITIHPTEWYVNRNDTTVPSQNSMVEPQGHEPTETSVEATSSFHGTNSTEISRTGRVRKKRAIDLNSCMCGMVVSQSDIDAGDTVMKCKGPGCETVWVSKQDRISQYLLIIVSMAVPP